MIRMEPGSFGPRRRRPRRLLGLLVGVVLVALITFRGLATAWTDYLWFSSVGATTVWSTVLVSQVVLGAAGFLVAGLVVWINLVAVRRISTGRFVLAGPADEAVERFQEWVSSRRRWFEVAVAALLGLFVGAGASGWWRNVLLYLNEVGFDIADPIFGRDVAFYVFRIPVYRDIIGFLFQLVIITILVSVAAHYLFGGIRWSSNRLPEVASGVKSHLSVLLAAMAILKAIAYRLDTYDLLYSTRGAIFGASFTDVNAHRPALTLLAAISLFAAGLLLWNIRRAGWILPAVAAGLWLVVSVVVGGIIPAAIERFQVQPDQFNKERPYIDHHIEFTLEAYGLGEGQVEIRDFAASSELTADDIAANQATISNVRLWDPGVLTPAYSQLQAIRPYYQISTVDTDRYVIDGALTQVMVAARELDSDDLPAEGWVNEKLVYTHGFGEVMSRASDVNPTTGEPAFLVRDVPPRSSVPELETAQPRIYFGEAEEAGSYVIVGTAQQEVDFPSGEGDSVVRNTYAGSGGVQLSNTAIRSAMALRFGDLNILISGLLTSESKVLMVRNVVDRLKQVAPFMYADDDPYLALIDQRLVWIVDLYSVSNRYPYSQPVIDSRLGFRSPLPRDLNYIRNSVKAVVDAEDGTMTLYVLEGADPLTLAYTKVFPDIFSDGSQMSDELRNHIRYPEDMFRLQSDIYATYHQLDAEDFFQDEDKWEVPLDPSSSDRPLIRGDTIDQLGQVRQETKLSLPYYLLMKLPGEENLSYLILQSFNPASRPNMTAFMVAKSDPGTYGKIVDYRLPRGKLINGLQQVSTRIDQDPVISQQFTLLGQQGSEIIRGNMLLVPIEESLMFVQPIYLKGEQVLLPEFKRVVVVFGEESPPIMRETLDAALQEVFGRSRSAPVSGFGEQPSDAADGPGQAGITGSEGLVSLIGEINDVFEEADAALRSGDLGGYQEKVDEVARMIRRLGILLEESAS
ncbi:MAG: UPF0182 family protein [bacterium]|nr:UPF0182 family protein [bacterium]